MAIRDKVFHKILFGIILLLIASTIYSRFFYKPLDPFQEIFTKSLSQFELEHSLQLKAEKIQPGAIKVPILIYHSVRPHSRTESAIQKYYDVAPESMEQQLQYLKDHNYVVISLDYLTTALDENIILPPKSVVITLDDGWRNQYSYAFPLLKKYRDTATFFIYTDPIGSDYFLTWDQVRVLNNSGMEIGGHTKTHPYLVSITDPSVLREEIISSKHIIEDQIGQKINTFAYPFGHYNDMIIGIVKEAGYKVARSGYKGINHVKADLFKLKGVEVTDDFKAFVQNLNN